MQITKTISDLNSTAEDWQLYANEDEAGANACAVRLNEKFMELVNAGGDRTTVERDMGKFMDADAQSKWGAADSEGYHMLEDLLDKVFGKEDW